MTRWQIVICAAIFGAVLVYGEAPKGASPGVTPGSVATYTATSANVSGAPDAIRIDILRWSTDAERDRLMDAWNGKTANAGGRGGRGAVGRAGAGRAGRGARGGEEAPPPAPPAPPTPDAMLAKALREATTVGYVWSREIAGYAIRYAGKMQNPDGSERIVLLTERRLGAVNDLWKPAGAEASPYEFSLIELRIKANGEGEGKTSLTGKVAPDSALKPGSASNMVTLDNYDSLPVVFAHVQRHAGARH
jgi:hypothetical protein